MSDQATRDNRMLEQLAVADGALIRLMNEAQYLEARSLGRVIALDEGSCFTPTDIIELKTAHLSIVRVLQQADALRRRAEVERSDP